MLTGSHSEGLNQMIKVKKTLDYDLMSNVELSNLYLSTLVMLA